MESYADELAAPLAGKQTGSWLICPISIFVAMKKFLVPVDFSAESLNAAQYALALAGEMNASIRLLHVSPFPVAEPTLSAQGYAPPLSQTRSLQEEIDLQAREQMKELRTALIRYAGRLQLETPIEEAYQTGDPQREIMHEAEDFRPDLIVMGNKGKGLMERWLLGSVSAKVIEHSPIPVLIIPGEASFKEQWREVIYATDFDPKDRDVLVDLFGLMPLEKAILHCVHFIDPATDSYFEEDTGQTEAELHELLGVEPGNGQISCEVVRKQAVREGLEHYLEAYPSIDLVVMCPHRRSFWGRLTHSSSTKQVLYRTQLPLLAYPIAD
jgi:nucleotide-binding universal stress UspA family protein